eukprot:Tbor_TRINITY_DN5690_c3_g1::TRINITY_DN5690_c3_g1_i1::g.9362::m.9362/K03260/EIF4G; translation initiation factor 4G
MQVYSVKDILACRDKFRDLPYPGFSLDEVVRRSRQQQGIECLKRGENAWKSNAATSVEEAILRRVRTCLNKITPEKYNDILSSLLDKTYFKTEKEIEILTKVIFNKALEEPGYSEMYARLCSDMAKFEVKWNRAKNNTEEESATDHSMGSPTVTAPSLSQIVTKQAQPPVVSQLITSQLRNGIIWRAENEFRSTNSAYTQAIELFEGEQLEERLSLLTRRKKANIKFVGQLFMQKVMKSRIMFTILHTILKLDQEDFIPLPVDVEVLSELLETIGKTLDTVPADKEKVDQLFERIDYLKELKDDTDAFVFPPMIRFRMMDLVELRRRNWEARVQRAGQQHVTTLSVQKQIQDGKEKSLLLPPGGKGSPSTTHYRANPGPQARFPAQPSVSANTSQTAGSWRNVVSTSKSSPGSYQSPTSAKTPGTSPATPSTTTTTRIPKKVIPLEQRVMELINQWVPESKDEIIEDWEQKLTEEGDTSFPQGEALRQQVVYQVVRNACSITKSDAQHIAVCFLIHGLCLDDADLYKGLSQVLADAINEGLPEDVPKFNERFAIVLSMLAGRTPEELALHGSKVLFNSFEMLDSQEEEDENIKPLIDIWDRLRTPDTPFTILTFTDMLSSMKVEQELLAANFVKSMIERDMVTVSTVKEWRDVAVSSTTGDGAILKESAELVMKYLENMKVFEITG